MPTAVFPLTPCLLLCFLRSYSSPRLISNPSPDQQSWLWLAFALSSSGKILLRVKCCLFQNTLSLSLDPEQPGPMHVKTWLLSPLCFITQPFKSLSKLARTTVSSCFFFRLYFQLLTMDGFTNCASFISIGDATFQYLASVLYLIVGWNFGVTWSASQTHLWTEIKCFFISIWLGSQ